MENKLIIICGLSFAGKSTLAKALAERFGCAEVDVDETKVQLFGQDVRDADLRPEDWVRIYAETDQRIAQLLRAGLAVVDASRNFSQTERGVARRLADGVGAPLITIYIDTPETVVRQRMLENRRTPQRRDISDQDFESVIRAMEPPSAAEAALVFPYTASIADWLSENSGRLG